MVLISRSTLVSQTIVESAKISDLSQKRTLVKATGNCLLSPRLWTALRDPIVLEVHSG